MSPEREAEARLNQDRAILREFAPANLQTAFEMLDAYHGPVSERRHWLANQWTSWDEDVSDARWAELERDADAVIRAWVARSKAAVRRMEELV